MVRKARLWFDEEPFVPDPAWQPDFDEFDDALLDDFAPSSLNVDQEPGQNKASGEKKGPRRQSRREARHLAGADWLGEQMDADSQQGSQSSDQG